MLLCQYCFAIGVATLSIIDYVHEMAHYYNVLDDAEMNVFLCFCFGCCVFLLGYAEFFEEWFYVGFACAGGFGCELCYHGEVFCVEA